MKRALAILLSILLPCMVYAQGSETVDSVYRKIDRYLASAVEAHKFNGIALVTKKGKVLLHKGYGWKNFESKSLNDTLTRFPILSITKSFTAIVILKLQEQKMLSLSDPVVKHLPEFPHGNKLTVEQLLTHTSGLYDFTDDIDERDLAFVNNPVERELITGIIYSKPLLFEPGTGFEYNNSGYFLAGLVIEKVTGKSYWQNVRDYIFEPLGMDNSGFDFNRLPEKTKAIGYQFLNSTKQKRYTYVDSTVSFSAGSIYSTTGDLYKWTQSLAKKQLLAPASWEIAFTPKASDYGLGFRVNRFLGKNHIKHSGGYPGFVSEFIYYPEEDAIIILLKNSGTYGEDVWPVTMGISSIIFDKPYDLWKIRHKQNLPKTVLEKLTGTYKFNEVSIQVSVKDNMLIMILPDGTELPLVAESPENFYLENFNTSFNFEKNLKDGSLKLIIHEHGVDTKFVKQ